VLSIFSQSPKVLQDNVRESWLPSQRTAKLISAGNQRFHVEFVCANRPGFDGGHWPSGVLGDTVSPILEAAGYKVDREYYYNVAGGRCAFWQFRLLGATAVTRLGRGVPG
jgi:arginyl-tRNA synthetase